MRAKLRPKWSDFMFERVDFRPDFGSDKADTGPQWADCGPERLILDLRGLILGLRGLSFGPERINYGPERAELGPVRGLGGDRRTDGWMDRRMSVNSALCPTGQKRFGAAAQKGAVNHRSDGDSPLEKEGRPLIIGILLRRHKCLVSRKRCD